MAFKNIVWYSCSQRVTSFHLLSLVIKLSMIPFLFNKFLSTSLYPKVNDPNQNSNENFYLIYTNFVTSNGAKMETFHLGIVRLRLVGINCLHLFPSMFPISQKQILKKKKNTDTINVVHTGPTQHTFKNKNCGLKKIVLKYKNCKISPLFNL